jgi:heme-binding NEAT domain protein
MGGLSVNSVHNKYSVKYYLNLVLVDEEDRRYFKQQEIQLWRKTIRATRAIGGGAVEGKTEERKAIDNTTSSPATAAPATSSSSSATPAATAPATRKPKSTSDDDDL